MTDREIRKYIDRLNHDKAVDSIFTRQISENVEVAKVWPEQPKKSDNINEDFSSFRFFFIKNEYQYVGAVLDMTYDLHWYVLPEYRGKGYLTNALKKSIIPFLFYEREFQRITINEKKIGEKNYLKSKNVAVSVGFKLINAKENKFELSKNDFDWNSENLNEINSEIGTCRIEELRKRIFFAYKLIHKTSDELLMAFDNDQDLKEIAKKIRKYPGLISKLEKENKKTKG